MEKKVLVISDSDNVGVAIKAINKNENISIERGHRNETILANEKIDFGHKFALKDIKKSDAIIKYGEIIGVASKNIKKGEHVHVHNVESQRGRGDLKNI